MPQKKIFEIRLVRKFVDDRKNAVNICPSYTVAI